MLRQAVPPVEFRRAASVPLHCRSVVRTMPLKGDNPELQVAMTSPPSPLPPPLLPPLDSPFTPHFPFLLSAFYSHLIF